MAQANKDTIYIDIDDEITGIIDKVRSSSGKIIALVLPKRAAVLQSIVNMKLLKRSADEAKKHLVLITSEAGLMPLAGAVGLHVAKSLQTKPEIPTPPQLDDDTEETVDESAEPEVTTATAGSRPVGELAGLGAAAPLASDDVETLEIDDDEPEETPPVAAAAAAAAGKPKLKKDKRLSVPNFERFRLLLILGGLLLILLIVGLIFALNVLPKAEITVKTNASDINASLNLNLATSATSLDPASNTVPAKQAQEQKTNSQQVAASGQQNKGTKATGTVVFYNCDKTDRLLGQDQTIPSGTGVSSNGLTYITQASANVSASSFKADGTCRKDQPSSSVTVVAQAAGTKYNMSGASFSVAYANPTDGSNSFSAQSSDGMSGGTDNIVKVVTQSDIDTATQKLTTQNSDSIRQDLAHQLEQSGYFAITTTLNAAAPNVTSSAKAGDTADNVTVTGTTTYTMLGAHESDLKKLVDTSVKNQIDTSKQSILSEGLDDAVFKLLGQNDGVAQVNMQTVATAGPHLDIASLKTQAAGKKSGEVQSQIGTDPGVTSVSVKLSPFWVSSIPKKTSRITVTIAKPTPATNHPNATNP